MDYSFNCKCGFSTNFIDTAKIHQERCVFYEVENEREVPITILIKALEEINDIITSALNEYKKRLNR